MISRCVDIPHICQRSKSTTLYTVWMKDCHDDLNEMIYWPLFSLFARSAEQCEIYLCDTRVSLSWWQVTMRWTTMRSTIISQRTKVRTFNDVKVNARFIWCTIKGFPFPPWHTKVYQRWQLSLVVEYNSRLCTICGMTCNVSCTTLEADGNQSVDETHLL